MNKHLSKLNDDSLMWHLDLPVRAYNVMNAAGCYTLGDVRKFFDRASSGEKFPGLGKATLEGIEYCLEAIDKAKEDEIRNNITM